MSMYNSIANTIEKKYLNGQYDHADQSSRPKRKRRKTCTLVDEQSKVYRERHQQRQRTGTSAMAYNDNEYEESNESDDDEKLAQYPRSSKRKKNSFTLEDSSSDDDDELSKKSDRRQKLMERRIDNIHTAKWIQDDIDGSSNQSVGEGGIDFNLVRAMRKVEEEDDNEDSDVEETRYQLQRRYENNQMKKSQRLASRLEADRTSTMGEPLFDAGLSDEDDERSKKDPAISIGVRLSNNNISINISQPVGNMMQCQPGCNYMMYRTQFQSFDPPYYQGNQYPTRAIDMSTQRNHSSYHITPRFLSRQATTVSKIESEVSKYFHLLHTDDQPNNK
eukprot:scaffold8686_cov122-Skeletonema_menzelii.AAC.5